MIKALDRMKVNCRVEQIGCMCMGQEIASARRTVRDEESGLEFQMIVRWASGWKELRFDTIGKDCEAFSWDTKRDHIDVPIELLREKKAQDIKDQLIRGICKRLGRTSTAVKDNMTGEDLKF